MANIRDAASCFLARERIAVVGVSRAGDTAANVIYKKLRETRYRVFPVNPNAEQVEGDPCFESLASIPGGVQAVVVATHPRVTASVVEECAALGVEHVWLHRSFGRGSVSDEGIHIAREHGMSIIVGGCPMMFCEPVDVAHRCMRWLLGMGHRPSDPGSV